MFVLPKTKSLLHTQQVDVTIWNTGVDAYRQDIFGGFITITRKLVADSIK